MFKHLVGTALVVTLAGSGVAVAGPIAQPYFTYSPGALDFEDIEWTPLDFAAFSAYGGYFANVRRPRYETPLPQLFHQEPDFGIEDEFRLQSNAFEMQTYVPVQAAFVVSQDENQNGVHVPEPGLLALIGVGLLAGSRSLRRRLTR